MEEEGEGEEVEVVVVMRSVMFGRTRSDLSTAECNLHQLIVKLLNVWHDLHRR